MHVGQAPDGDDENGDDEDVGRLHPQRFAVGEAQVRTYHRQGHGHDARVEGRHEHAHRSYDEHAPPPAL